MSIRTYARNNESIVGKPLGGLRGISDGGIYQFFTKGVIYQHSRKGTLGFIPNGPILETWWLSGYEHGYFGYPTSAAESRIRLDNIPFEGGRIRATTSSGGFSVLVYNTQLITPFGYNGRGRSRQVNRLIEVLKSNSPDVICLNEVFDDDERDKISAHLRSTHPHRVDAPDEWGPLEDGGLLLLSKHRIINKDQIIFRVNAGNDHYANKGIIHARVAINGRTSSPNLLDVYVTHHQAGYHNVKMHQARIGASFIAAKSLKKVPAIYVGDFNLDFNSRSYGNELNYPIDSWESYKLFNGLNTKGITSDKARTYRSGSLPKNDPKRGVNGGRIDAIFKYPSSTANFSVGKVAVMRYELIENSGIDLSDHYGVRYDGFLQRVGLNFNRNIIIRGITIHLSRLHCLDTTSGPGEDEIKLLIRLGINGRRHTEGPYVKIGDMDDGETRHINNRSLSAYDNNGISRIKCSVRVREMDDFPGSDDTVGDTAIDLTREELLLHAKYNPHDRRMNVRHPIAVPLMRGDGSRYVAYFTYDLHTITR